MTGTPSPAAGTDQPSSRGDALADAYWKLYNDNYSHVRHHELQRSTVATAIIAIAGALIAIISYGEKFTWDNAPLAALVAVLGQFGSEFSAKQWERATRHKDLALAFRDAFDRQLGGSSLKDIEREADMQHRATFSKFATGPIHNWMTRSDPTRRQIPAGSVREFWRFLYGFITVIGIILLCLSIGSPLLQAWEGRPASDAPTIQLNQYLPAPKAPPRVQCLR